jgi:HPt (histidine-containing phosphotransfer) domain-containing protein
MSESLLDSEMLDSYRELGTPEDPHFFRNYLQTFLDGLPPHLEGIDRAIGSGNSELLAREAHALKSSCMNVGAKPVVERAAKLESLGKIGRLDGAAELALEVSELCRKLGEEIRSLPEFLK